MKNRRSKTVYSYNRRKRFVGTELAYETWDFAEPPIWLIPAGATEKEPLPFDVETEVAVFDESRDEWKIIERPTPENTIPPEYDPFTFKIQWNEAEERWDLEKHPPSPENTPKPNYNSKTHEISWDYIKKNWKITEIPTPENTTKPEFSQFQTEEDYEIVWNKEILNWEFKRKINWNYIRKQRDFLLKQSDWSAFPDANPKPSKEAWLNYRQALRDVPQNFSNPEEVIWPLPPQ